MRNIVVLRLLLLEVFRVEPGAHFQLVLLFVVAVRTAHSQELLFCSLLGDLLLQDARASDRLLSLDQLEPVDLLLFSTAHDSRHLPVYRRAVVIVSVLMAMVIIIVVV